MIKIKSKDGTRMVEGRRIMNSDNTPTAYVITEDGQLYSDELQDYRVLDPPTQQGYIMVSLSIDNEWKKMLVHRLVADAFLSNEYNYPCVNHKDGNKKNNDYHNLEHCTYEYNSKYAVVHGGSNYMYQQFRSKLSVDQLKEICQMIQDGYRNVDIANKFGVNKNYISNIRCRFCHTGISKDYDFGDNFVYYGDNLTGNEGNNYIPPLSDEDEPKYLRRDSPEIIEQLCKLLSQDEYVSNDRAGLLFSISPKIVKKIRNGELYTEISKKYNINNNKLKRAYHKLSDESDEFIENIFKVLSSGKYTLTSAGALIGIDTATILRLIDDPAYNSFKEKWPINIKYSRKGHPLTKEEINKIVELLVEGTHTRQAIADMVGVSLESVVKIKRAWKNGTL